MKVANKDLNTFDGWKANGRFVMKGEKAHGRNHDGKPLFRKDQTDVYEPRDRSFEQGFGEDDLDDGTFGGFTSAYDIGADF